MHHFKFKVRLSFWQLVACFEHSGAYSGLGWARCPDSTNIQCGRDQIQSDSFWRFGFCFKPSLDSLLAWAEQAGPAGTKWSKFNCHCEDVWLVSIILWLFSGLGPGWPEIPKIVKFCRSQIKNINFDNFQSVSCILGSFPSLGWAGWLDAPTDSHFDEFQVQSISFCQL